MSIGDPVARFHLEVETKSCICNKLGCGGVLVIKRACPEHGFNTGPEGKFHTHGLQTGRILVGTRAL